MQVTHLFQTCAKINFHQRSGGNPIPPSPGDESSVFWRTAVSSKGCFFFFSHPFNSLCVQPGGDAALCTGQNTSSARLGQSSPARTSKANHFMFLKLWSLQHSYYYFGIALLNGLFKISFLGRKPAPESDLHQWLTKDGMTLLTGWFSSGRRNLWQQLSQQFGIEQACLCFQFETQAYTRHSQ